MKNETKTNATSAEAAILTAILARVSGPLATKYRMAAVLRGREIAILDTRKANRVCAFIRLDMLGNAEVESVKLGQQTLFGSVGKADVRGWISR